MLAPSTPQRAAHRFSSAPTASSPRRTHDESHEKPAAAASSAEASNASQDFAEAMKALSRGDFSAGAGKLEGFALAHPRDPRVEDAAYLQAIALERAGRLEGARAAARRYLAVYPDGAHHAQARRIAGE
jgi:outer membrane protein assembly factor BamD (BamD/ComL family)